MPSLIADARARGQARVAARIDYDRMNRAMPKLKAQLARAVKTGDPEQIAAACLDAIDEWEACGAWPDQWSAWQRALDEVLPWHQHVELTDLRRPPEATQRLF